MSNRLLWLLIVLWFILSGILFFIYYFVYYNGTIIIKSNLDDYKVELFNKKLLKTLNFDCPDFECKLMDISPFDYKIKIDKQEYRTYENDISVWRNDILSLDINLEKDTSLTKIESVESEVDKAEKLNFLKEKKNIYTYFNLGDSWIFYFKENGNNLDLYKNSEELFSIKKIAKEEIDLKLVIWIEDYIYIKHWDSKFLYSLALDKKTEIDLNIDIKYIKSWLKRHLFQFVTDKWTFIFNKHTLKSEYFSFFNDFIYHDDWYIWIITKDDERRLNNLWFESKWKNIIVYYNPNTKEKKILYKTDLEVTKIFKSWDNYMFVANDWKEYKLDNF